MTIEIKTFDKEHRVNQSWPVDNLEVGQGFTIPWPEKGTSSGGSTYKAAFEKRKPGWKFNFFHDKNGINIFRIA